MSRLSLRALVVASFIALAGCHGQSSAPNYAPAGFTVAPGDGQVAVTFNQESGLTYWIFYIAGSSVSTTDSGTSVIYNAQSPGAVTGLANGTQYAFVMNATNRDSKGGPATPMLTATPRLAGSSWVSGSPLTPQNLSGVTYGASNILGVITNMIVAVGDSGSIFSGPFNYFSANPPGVTSWTQATVPAGFVSNLSAVVATGSSFVALGADGSILTSADGNTWTTSANSVPCACNSTTTMNGMVYGTPSGVALYVAVGTGGNIFTSPDLGTWTQRSNTGDDLYGIAYLNGSFIATGKNGALWTSADGVAWNTQNIGTTILRSVTYGIGSAGAYYVAVGDAGTILTSTDKTNWNPPSTSPPTLGWRSITFGSRFVAVGQGGTVAYSDDAINWLPPSVGPSPLANLNSVIWTPAMYIAVGALGANAIAR